MRVFRSLFLLSNFLQLSLHLPACEAFVPANTMNKTVEEHAASLISWLQKEGGYINPKLEMRRFDPSDPSTFFGMYTNDDIDKDEVLFRIPYSMVLKGDYDGRTMTCATVRVLVQHLKLKDESKYAPWVNYLLDAKPLGPMPSSWSDSGKALFRRVLGGYGDYPIELPLQDDPFPWVDEWSKGCDGSDDPLEEYAALTVVQRTWDEIMIPVLDMLSHRNGNWLNSYHTDVFSGDDIYLKAKRDIEAKEQIYTSYNMCDSCGNRYFDYGTAEILRDYGFVEQMPQTWIFDDFFEFEFGARIDMDYNEDGEPNGDHLVKEYIFREPDEEIIDAMEDMIDQIIKVKEEILNVRDEKVLDHEWNTINQFIDALKFALEIIIDAYYEDDYDIEVVGVEDDDDDDDGHDEL